MDREKIIKQLNDALDNLRSDFDKEIRSPVTNMHGNDWDQSPKLLEDCRYIYEQLTKSIQALANIQETVREAQIAIDRMYFQWQQIKAISGQATISDAVHSVVDEFLAGTAAFLPVEEAVKKVETKKAIYAKNKRAVVASFLGRDRRLERIEKSKFARRLESEMKCPACNNYQGTAVNVAKHMMGVFDRKHIEWLELNHFNPPDLVKTGNQPLTDYLTKINSAQKP